MIAQLRKEIQKAADPRKATFVARFFKTDPGDYGEGDVFIGLTVPQCRKIVAAYHDLSLEEIGQLLQSKIHEERLIALLLLVHQFQKGDQSQKKDIYTFYLAHTKFINNWDLVDLSADKIVGEYLFSQSVIASEAKQSHREGIATSSLTPRNDDILVILAQSDSLWERRIAMIATYAFIKNGESDLTFKIADILLHDSHDLIQKAVGWMLRESLKRTRRSISQTKISQDAAYHAAICY
ncbi:MAG: DNA alkylation repair protein [Patescibacteria group bacterium]